MSKSKKLTIAAVAIFVIGFLLIRNAESAELGVGLGYGIANSDAARVQELSVASNDYRWFASYSRIGRADNDRIAADQTNRFVGAYRACFWRDRSLTPCLSMGVAYFDEPLMGLLSDNLTYDLRIVVRYKDIVEIDIDQHNSTAGRSERNSGFDAVMIRGIFRF